MTKHLIWIAALLVVTHSTIFAQVDGGLTIESQGYMGGATVEAARFSALLFSNGLPLRSSSWSDSLPPLNSAGTLSLNGATVVSSGQMTVTSNSNSVTIVSAGDLTISGMLTWNLLPLTLDSAGTLTLEPATVFNGWTALNRVDRLDGGVITGSGFDLSNDVSAGGVIFVISAPISLDGGQAAPTIDTVTAPAPVDPSSSLTTDTITLDAAPEPSTVALLLASLIIGGVWATRRRGRPCSV